ncbi:MAG: GNAT family N-acetyltransferase [Phycisphaerales bacterium]|nr:GNAT family N-acetyltransferase [Phycisphaerales bacterium]
MNPRLLTASDIDAYRAIRLEMLNDSPWAFASSPEDDRAFVDGAMEELVADPEHKIVVVDHPDDDRLACAVGVRRETKAKFRHRVSIWGVYTTPTARGKGLARMAMEHAIGIARSWEGVRYIGLAVSANAPAALALYESLGFVRWGHEPAATCIDGVEYDELYLSMKL